MDVGRFKDGTLNDGKRIWLGSFLGTGKYLDLRRISGIPVSIYSAYTHLYKKASPKCMFAGTGNLNKNMWLTASLDSDVWDEFLICINFKVLEVVYSRKAYIYMLLLCCRFLLEVLLVQFTIETV